MAKKKFKRKVEQGLGLQQSASFHIKSSAMALTVTANLTDVDLANSTTGWGVSSDISAGWGLNTDEPIQGSGCISGQSKNTNTDGTIYYDNGSDIDLTAETLRVWLRFTEIAKMVSAASTAAGAAIYVEDSSGNWGMWNLGGADGGVSEVWENYAVDTAKSFHRTSATAPTMTAIRRIGVNVRMATKPARADNIYIDAIRYGDGLTITGTVANSGDGFSEIADADENSTNQYGVFRRDSTGNYVLKGKLVFGDSAGTGSTDFSDNQNSKIFIPTSYFQAVPGGTSSLVGCSIENRPLGFEIVGNGTGTTDFELGTLLGTGDDRQGILGGIFSGGTDAFTFDAETDTSDIDSCNLYGVTFEGADVIKLSGSTTQEAIGCSFIGCREIQPNNAEFLNNQIIGPLGRGLEMLSTNAVKQIDFIAGNDLYPLDIFIKTGATWANMTASNTDIATVQINNAATGGGLLISNYAYFGFREIFGLLRFNLLTARVGGTQQWDYYQGSGNWGNLSSSIINDATNFLGTGGTNDLEFTPPSDWAKGAYLTEQELYYIRWNSSAGSPTTDPNITQAWIGDVFEYHTHFPVAGTIAATELNFFGHPAAPGFPKYHIENSANATTADSYADTNQDSTQAIGNGTITGAGQSITGNGGVLSRIRVDLSKTGTPTGTAVAKVYAHSGTFGTSSVPTGTELATSNTIDVSDLTTTLTLTDFEFEDEFTLVNTTNYVFTIEYSGGDVSNYINIGTDTSSPSHGGNFSTFTSPTWSAVSGTDAVFFVYTGGIVKLTATGGNPSTTIETGSPPGATIIDQSVNIDIKVIDAATLANVQGARVYLKAASGGGLPVDTEILTPASQVTDSNGEVSDTFSFSGNQPVIGWVRRSTTTPLYKESPLAGTITNEGFSQTAAMALDE